MIEGAYGVPRRDTREYLEDSNSFRKPRSTASYTKHLNVESGRLFPSSTCCAMSFGIRQPATSPMTMRIPNFKSSIRKSMRFGVGATGIRAVD